MAGDRELVRKMVEADAAKYAAEKKHHAARLHEGRCSTFMS